MPNIFSLIGDSWDFFRKQPVLNHVVLWLMALPMAAVLSLGQLEDTHPAFAKGSDFEHHSLLVLLVLFAELALSIIMIWGTACTLLVSKKLVGNSAGRTRTSFKKVRNEAASFVANIFLTGILRSCFILFWSVLLIVPGIIYAVRSYFYNVAIVCEGKEFRTALQRSKEVVIGNTPTVFLYLLGLSVVLFTPAVLVSGVISIVIDTIDSRFLIPVNIINAGIWSLLSMIFTIASVLLYAALQNLPKNIIPTT